MFAIYGEQTDVQPVIKANWVARQCENAHQLATQYQTLTERGMEPIWIMDARVLMRERLRSMRCGDPVDALRDSFVLWEKFAFHISLVGISCRGTWVVRLALEAYATNILVKTVP